MRHFSVTIVLIFIIPSVTLAQLRIVPPITDLGELRGGPVYQLRVSYVNDSRQPIEITGVKLGCGCLQVAISHPIVQPGEKGAFAVNVRTLGQPSGPRRWQATVSYRHGMEIVTQDLTVAGNLVNEVSVEPAIIAMTVDSTLRQEVILKDSRAKPMKITAIVASSPAIRISGQRTNAGITRVVLEVSRADLTTARQEETLNIYTDDPTYRHLQVPISLIKATRAAVAAWPGKVELTGSTSQLVRLRGVGDQLVRIEKVESDHDAVKCTWAAGPGNDATLKISASTAITGAANVRVHLLHPAGAVINVPIMLRRE